MTLRPCDQSRILYSLDYIKYTIHFSDGSGIEYVSWFDPVFSNLQTNLLLSSTNADADYSNVMKTVNLILTKTFFKNKTSRFIWHGPGSMQNDIDSQSWPAVYRFAILASSL